MNGKNNPNWRGGICSIKSSTDLESASSVLKDEVQRRLFSNFKIGRDKECWNWNGPTFKSNGRACLHLGQRVLASRLMFVLVRGKLGKSCVLHTCDNVLCVNPKHLVKGSNQDNSDDMVRKGRQATGDRNGSRLYPERLVRGANHLNAKHPERVSCEKNPNVKLSAKDVRAIRRLYRRGRGPYDPGNSKDLSERFGVSNVQIRAIAKGESWKRLSH